MRYTLTLPDELAQHLTNAIFDTPGIEGAAYLLCGISTSGDETRLLGRSVVPVRTEHYLRREALRLSICSESYVPVAKRARRSKEAILFVHSHPEACPAFSTQDDREEAQLLAFFQSRAPDTVHGSMVFSSPSCFQARVLAERIWVPLARVRMLGGRFQFVDQCPDEQPLPDFFDRQVRAFGPDVQRLLRRLHIGVVGAGGTGSAVIEQATRLGVGEISVFDGDDLERGNVTRVYGSTIDAVGTAKTQIQQEHVTKIGLGTKIVACPRPITEEAVAKELRRCDIVFGATDKQAPRGVLVRLAIRYYIPVFDMAVKIHAENQTIRGVWGRVTTLLPGHACLFCRGTIDPDTIRAETVPPAQRERELAEGYITGLATDEPAVVMFTSAVAAQAISEMLHRLTGFMGSDRRSTETLMLFHEGRIRTNATPARSGCACRNRDLWGRGDTRNFLDLVW